MKKKVWVVCTKSDEICVEELFDDNSRNYVEFVAVFSRRKDALEWRNKDRDFKVVCAELKLITSKEERV